MARAKLAVAYRGRLLPAAGHGRDVHDDSAQNSPAKAVAAGKGNVAPAGVLALQRRIGNRSTVALLQRDPEDEDLRSGGGHVPEGGVGRRGLRVGCAPRPRRRIPRLQQTPEAEWPAGDGPRYAATLGPEKAAKFGKLMEGRQARQKKTTTAGGAFIASQVNSKEKIGSAAAYTTPEEREGHLGEFLRGAHAFVSNDAYLKIRGEHLSEANFNAWGAGSNFVAPLSDADKLVEVASRPGGPRPVRARAAAWDPQAVLGEPVQVGVGSSTKGVRAPKKPHRADDRPLGQAPPAA